MTHMHTPVHWCVNNVYISTRHMVDFTYNCLNMILLRYDVKRTHTCTCNNCHSKHQDIESLSDSHCDFNLIHSTFPVHLGPKHTTRKLTRGTAVSCLTKTCMLSVLCNLIMCHMNETNMVCHLNTVYKEIFTHKKMQVCCEM